MLSSCGVADSMLNSKHLKLTADLADAGIEYCKDGKFFDFHSQRHETGTLLLSSLQDFSSNK